MKRTLAVGALLVALAACGDPATNDRRGYTKAPLENPGLLIGGEDATEMARLNRPNLPRPPREIELPTAGGGEADEEARPASLAPGVTQAQFDQGRQLFSGQGGCQACHGPGGGGTQLGPDLTDGAWLNVAGPDLQELARVIQTGVPQPMEYPAPMPPMGGADLNPEQVQALAAYVASLASG
ncbi:MAG TPA: c-type cytochrome [Longimicrobiales bacterium]|nr:c-type cytochrome [Longimicrobiales bacterium]